MATVGRAVDRPDDAGAGVGTKEPAEVNKVANALKMTADAPFLEPSAGPGDTAGTLRNARVSAVATRWPGLVVPELF